MAISSVRRPGVGQDRPQDFGEADRVLDQRQEQLAILDLDALEAAEGGGEASRVRAA